ncbi:GntR family transcriptional regulator [Shumkonia mesophila]|uniref:GntR family transcriptional regulator n=1 Tax=Shumkonia mesophila TaxID=2838854 RepID=UPI002934363E|nr:GntR family transcriptional regulator [Shumkonia mesophila]
MPAPAPLVLDRTRLATVQVYERIRDDIVSLRLKPGEALSVNDLAAQFGTSRSPVREAIIRLANEGLVEIFPQSGTRVSPIRMSDVREVYFVRRAVEAALVHHLAREHTLDQVKVLRGILSQQKECVGREDVPGFYKLDELFHHTIADFAGYPGVWRLMHVQKFQMDRLRHFVLPMPSRSKKIVKEHKAIIDAIAKGDPTGAGEAMGHHLQQVFVIQEVLRTSHPEYFE